MGVQWVHIGATWRIRLNHPCGVAMRPFCQSTLNNVAFIVTVVVMTFLQIYRYITVPYDR